MAATPNLWATAKFVAPHTHHLQPFEVPAALREPPELVVRKVQIIQRGELAEALREAAEFVFNHVQRLQCSELAEALW